MIKGKFCNIFDNNTVVKLSMKRFLFCKVELKDIEIFPVYKMNENLLLKADIIKHAELATL